MAPIEEPAQRQALRDLLLFLWQDNRQAWELDADGSYRQRQPPSPESERASHRALIEGIPRV